MGKTIGKLTIVGHQEKTGGVYIEASYRKKPDINVLEQVRDNGPSFGIL